MHYVRPAQRNIREITRVNFELGLHQATIKVVTKRKSKNGKNMFVIDLEGVRGERGEHFLVFDTVYTEKTLTRLLASIEDNGVTIPTIAFGCNRQTDEFLVNKKVYILVEERMNGRKKIPSITDFLLESEYKEGTGYTTY